EGQILTAEAAVNVPAGENKADEEKSSTLLDEQCYVQDEPILEKYDEKKFQCQILNPEAAVNGLNGGNKVDEETPSAFLDNQSYLQDESILEKYDENIFAAEALTIEGDIAAPFVENKTVQENSSAFFDEQSYLQDAQILENCNEKVFAAEILAIEGVIATPTAEHIAVQANSSAFLDEQCDLKDIPAIPVEFEILNHRQVVPIVHKIAAHEKEANFLTPEIPSTNGLTKCSKEKAILEEKPDSRIATNVGNFDEQVVFENKLVSSDQIGVLEECYDTAEIGISKKEILTTKKKRVPKLQAFKTRLLNITSSKTSTSGNMTSTSNHFEHPEKSGAFDEDEESGPKRKRGFSFWGCLFCA
ncbi:hypothetical protein AVEN_202939-1, partial [Araneus ventricosus]